MTRARQILLIIGLVPILLLVFVVIHEEGHTILSRLFGDSTASFTLVEFRSNNSFCLGCNTFDHTKLSYIGSIMVSLGGLIASQIVALIALFVLRGVRPDSFPRRLLKAILIIFAFLDVAMQVLQGIMIDLSRRTYPTNTDLTDFMLLLSNTTGLNQYMLKVLLLVLAMAYLFAIYRFGFYKKGATIAAAHS